MEKKFEICGLKSIFDDKQLQPGFGKTPKQQRIGFCFRTPFPDLYEAKFDLLVEGSTDTTELKVEEFEQGCIVWTYPLMTIERCELCVIVFRDNYRSIDLNAARWWADGFDTIKHLILIDCDISRYDLNLVPQDLTLYDCKSLNSLMNSEHLRFIQGLNLYNCRCLDRVDHSLNLPALKTLYLDSGTVVTDIHKSFFVPCLESLIIMNGSSLKCVAGLENLKNLKKLHLREAHKLKEYTAFGGLKFLEEFYISGCQHFGDAFPILHMKMLKQLFIVDCGFNNLQGLEDFMLLEKICLSKSDIFKNIEKIGDRFELSYNGPFNVF